MKNNKRIIGVCLTKAENDSRTDFLTNFCSVAAENNCKLIVFNCPRDLCYGNVYDKGASSVFDMINYKDLDAVIILYDTFLNKQIADDIADKAEKNKVPAVLIHGKRDNCLCIVPEYTEAYKETIRHLFKIHGIKRPVFMGGLRDNHETAARLGCFKDVLSEYGLECGDNVICCGERWDMPARKAARNLVSDREKAPDAIVCASDNMALAVCDELRKIGYNVPEDIKVTGFDGISLGRFFIPELTTCMEDKTALAKLTMDILNDALSDGVTKGIFTEKYVPHFSTSCGCYDNTVKDYSEAVRDLFRMNYETKQHETHIYNAVDGILSSETLDKLSVALCDYILPDSSVCLREKFIMTALGQIPDKAKEQSFNDYIVLSSVLSDGSNGKQGSFPASDMIPGLTDWLGTDTVCIITPVFVRDEVCGYYVCFTDDIVFTAPKLFRVSKTLNIAFKSLLACISRRSATSGLINAHFNDSLTGLPNYRGLVKWFDEFAADENNHSMTVAVSIYNIPQYKYISENYGASDVDEAVRFTADALRLANKDNGFIARTGNDEFIIFNYVEDQNKISEIIDNAVSVFFGVIETYNDSSDKDYFIEVNCGCTTAYAGWNSSLSSFIKLAKNEMYINKLKYGKTPVLKEERLPIKGNAKIPKSRYNEFCKLIDNNLFTYYFQPIIEARTGEIKAYEALMRTTGGINMNPLEVLDIAKEHNRLYEVERATMFNVMERYERDKDKFGSAKIFINTIPGNFLKNGDLEMLKDKFGKYISNFVFEITEQDTVTDEELNSIRSLGIIGNTDEFKGVEGGRIAVDDYGTGHSNIVNLLRYAPHIIKIDRFLISNIQEDPNKQMFVKSTIEFAKMNHIKVLAEGVETYEEMRTVIDYGVDLIQGYYTARPAEEPLAHIPDSIRNEIIAENLILSGYENDMLVYHPKDGEVVKLYDLAIKKYGCIHIMGGSITVVGTFGQVFETGIVVEPGADVNITLDNVSIKAIDEPAIRLDSGSKATFVLKGSNKIEKNGFLVPANASARFVGDGNLTVLIKRNGNVGIGNYFDNSYGDITFEHSGEITIEIQADKCVSIGGGTNYGNSSINILSGKISVLAQCVNSIGIGSVKGRPDINISPNAFVSVKCSGKNAVAVGSFDGDAHITSSGTLDVVSDGERCAAIGTIGTGYLEFTCESGTTKAVVHSAKAVCIGSISGRSSINITDGRVVTYGEGDMIVGYGSLESQGTTTITGGSANVKILSGCIMQFGGDKCTTIITGGNVIAADEEDVIAVNAFGDPLHPEHPGGDSFCTMITTPAGDYMYKADKHEGDEDLAVYIP